MLSRLFIVISKLERNRQKSLLIQPLKIMIYAKNCIEEFIRRALIISKGFFKKCRQIPSLHVKIEIKKEDRT